MPIVAGIGGNAGTQTLTILVRGMALGDISPRDMFVAWRKEVLVGLTMGLAIGTVLALIVTVITGNSTLGLLVGSALILNLLAATTAGVCVPLTLRILRVDPALGAAWRGGDSIRPWTTWATCESGFGFRRKASAPQRRASFSISTEPYAVNTIILASGFCSLMSLIMSSPSASCFMLRRRS
jgi:hypothetical protein